MSCPIETYDENFREVLKSLRGVKHRGDQADPITMLTQRQKRDDPLTALAQRVEHIAVSGSGVSARDLERILGRNDLLPINYLERGMMAARTVCRIYVSALFGRNGNWGTGFLISPRLLITNNHVIDSIEAAQRAIAEFGYQLDIAGSLRQGKRFLFAPELAFITDKDLDFTLVAVAEKSEDGSASLSDYGFLRLDPSLHKVEEEEFVTIIQHPDGEEKYIAVRENEVIKIGDQSNPQLDNFLWYASDTAPGSSGSPAFNDNWQVVAIHHRSVPVSRKRDDGTIEFQLITDEWVSEKDAEQQRDTRIKWIANEGVRTSRIIAKIEEIYASQNSTSSGLVQDFLDDAKGVRVFPGTKPRESVVAPAILPTRTTESTVDDSTLERSRGSRRSVRPLSYYNGRKGYESDFLGESIPLPQVTQSALNFGPVAPVQGALDGVLRYTHFSIVMSQARRMAFYTAANIDGKRWTNLTRGDDEWFYDPRLSMNLQVGNELYGNEPGNFFDRGHLVRRLDPVWGSMQDAKLANDDTFHWTNCSPQYWAFNQGEELWQGLENFILYNTDQEDLRATVFTGPVFGNNDEEHRGVLIPQYFWKVVVVRDRTGKLYSSAYVVSQERYAQNIPFERLPIGEHNNFQVSIAKLEQRTGLAFSNVVGSADVYSGLDDRPLRGLGDVVHPRW
jgi:endonuclease G